MDPTTNITTGVAAGRQLDEKSKLRLQKAAKDFEAVFVGYMLKSMRGSIKTTDLFGDSFGGDLMDGMFDSEFARQISGGSNFKMAEILYRQMTGEKMPAENSRQPYAAPADALKQPVKPVNSAGKATCDKTIDGRISEFSSIISQAAENHNVDPNLIKAIIASESSGNPLAESPKQARGIMQLIDSTAQEMGVKNVWDPKENIFGGAKYLRQMLDTFGGDVKLAVASYNAGPGNVEKEGGIPQFKETQEYVQRVMNYLSYFEQKEPANE